jgi:nucleotide-binding universal stress UspA family protein
MPEPIRKILSAVDFSASSERAFDYALAVARSTGATLHILHAWRAPPWSPPVGSPPVDQTTLVDSVLDSWCRIAEHELDTLRGRAEADGVACQTHLEVGIASATIARSVDELGVDLVLLGARGRSALAHVLLGSAAERVMRISSCPVVVVPERAPAAPRLPLRKAVVAVDFSPPARRALELALRLGRALGRPEIVLLYAHYLPREIETMVGEEVARALDAVENRPHEQLEEWSHALRDEGWRVRCRVVHERPEDAIVRLAEAERADLITLGVHGHVPLAAALLGSVAQRVVRRAPCPVGSVR